MDGRLRADGLREEEVHQQINKRLTLNLLIQGAAAHTCLTAHHVVRESLRAVEPGLIQLYDRLAVSLILNYFIGDIPLLFGRPSRFWKNIDHPTSPFRGHRLLVQHGGELWRASKRYLLHRAKEKRISGVPLVHYMQAIPLALSAARAELEHRFTLARIAEQANSLIWNVDPAQLDGQLTTEVAFGNLREPVTKLGRLVRRGAVGYGGVEFRNGQPVVVAKAWLWPLLIHELVKGTAELVCLHGLNRLDDQMYAVVLDRADHIEYETWMLQAGPELWRRFLAAKPTDTDLAALLMHVARLEPVRLEWLMLLVVRDAAQARRQLADLVK